MVVDWLGLINGCLSCLVYMFLYLNYSFMFTCIGLFIQSIFMCQLFFICLVYILLCRLGLFNNWVGFLITQVYFIVFIEVYGLGLLYTSWLG